jgi:hypothetical protein
LADFGPQLMNNFGATIRTTGMKTKQTPSVQRPKRERIARVQVRIPVINQIQPAILQRTAVGFDLSKRESVERSTVFRADLDDHLVVIILFFDCG